MSEQEREWRKLDKQAKTLAFNAGRRARRQGYAIRGDIKPEYKKDFDKGTWKEPR